MYIGGSSTFCYRPKLLTLSLCKSFTYNLLRQWWVVLFNWLLHHYVCFLVHMATDFYVLSLYADTGWMFISSRTLLVELYRLSCIESYRVQRRKLWLILSLAFFPLFSLVFLLSYYKNAIAKKNWEWLSLSCSWFWCKWFFCI